MKIIIISAVWCPSCLVMKKIYQKVLNKFPDYENQFLDIDFDEEAKNYSVGDKLPVMILVKGTVEIARLNGEKSETEIVNFIGSLK